MWDESIPWGPSFVAEDVQLLLDPFHQYIVSHVFHVLHGVLPRESSHSLYVAGFEMLCVKSGLSQIK